MSQSTTVRASVQPGGSVRVSVQVRPKFDQSARRPDPLAVRLPDIPTVPEVWRGATYVLRKLLGSGNTNPKLRKSNAAGTPFQTWGLALAPAKESGFQLCSSSSPACRAGCLYRQGHARLDHTIAACRIAKSVALREHRGWFKAQLLHELGVLVRRADAGGLRVAVRLNLTSDVLWERVLPDLFWRFPAVQFYDYTKHVSRMLRFLGGDLPRNYHLTFSRSEDNDLQCRDVLDAGGNVAVVFRSREFPTRFLGAPVIDGDETDLRFMDPAGVVVGLSAKGTAKTDTSGFVVDADRPRLTLHTV
ncbi:MAG TPA: hypothetical protein VD866_16720 [Urbifossiella sp.]|nr:hypothetical protein [Urbifossiella sp.]